MEEYISFVDFSDTLNNIKINQEQKVKIRGLNMEFDLEITDDITASLDSGFQDYTKNTTVVGFQTCTPNCVPFSLGSF